MDHADARTPAQLVPRAVSTYGSPLLLSLSVWRVRAQHARHPMAAEELMVETVAQRLRAEQTRACALDALEALPAGSIPRELALAAAPALVDVAAGTVNRGDFDRSTLLLARLIEEAAPDLSVFSAALSGERLEAYYGPRLVVEAMQRALGGGGVDSGGLTREDAHSVACWAAWEAPSIVRGYSALAAAAGHKMLEWLDTVRGSFPAECVIDVVHRAD